jgi:hypothetical protein
VETAELKIAATAKCTALKSLRRLLQSRLLAVAMVDVDFNKTIEDDTGPPSNGESGRVSLASDSSICTNGTLASFAGSVLLSAVRDNFLCFF